MVLDIDTVQLQAGGHRGPSEGGCLMEWVSHFAGEPWSDHPACVSPVIAAFLRKWNDDLGAADRQMLRPYIRKVVGTNTGAADDDRRAWRVTDWMVRVYLPAWLRLAKLDAQAGAVSALPELTDAASWGAIRPTVEDARKAWAAARAAAWAALKPTVVGLQQSALQLLDRLIAVGVTA